MLCWPVYIVGGFFLSLLIVDISTYSWDALPLHAGMGITFTGLYYLFCLLFGNSISMAVLFVPIVFILMFFLASSLLFNNINTNKCCMTCGNNPTPKSDFLNFFAWMFNRTSFDSPLPTCPPVLPSPSPMPTCPPSSPSPLPRCQSPSPSCPPPSPSPTCPPYSPSPSTKSC
jgi:hypothetical protein